MDSITISTHESIMKISTRDKNPRNITALNHAYLSHQLVIFYGAGLSKPLGLPDWENLIDNIQERFIGEEYENDNESNAHRKKIMETMVNMDFWKRINFLQRELEISDQEIKDALVEIMSEGEQLNCPMGEKWEDNNYEDLAKMDINLFITTNYDKVFPKCLSGHCEEINFIKNEKSISDYLNSSDSDKKIIYLHGIVDDPSSIVISEEDVKKVYHNQYWSTAFATVLNASKVLFIGVSFSDCFLVDFIKERIKYNKNSFYAMVLDELDEKVFPGTQIIVDKNNPVADIKDMLEKISRETENIIILRLYLPSFEEDDKKDKINKIIKYLSHELNIFNRITTSCVDSYVLFWFQTYKAGQSLYQLNKQISAIVNRCAMESIISGASFVCFVSQNIVNVGKKSGAINIKFMKDQTSFLTKYILPNSNGFIIDKISLELTKAEDKEWIQTFSDKKGVIVERERQYSVYAEDAIKFLDAHNSGTEVHVAALMFLGKELLLEKRNLSEASVPDKYSLPGGRIKKGEGFKEALERILSEKYALICEIGDMVDEFKVFDANIPGLAYVVFINNLPKSFQFALFDHKRIEELRPEQLACSRDLIDKGFSQLNKRKLENIKLRIIMLTECVHNCRCCHHENIQEIFETCQIEEIEKNLKILRDNFNISQITITGGEPLLPQNRIKLLRLLKYIRNFWEDIDLSIITNAYYLDDEAIKELSQFHIRYKISVYGYDNKSFSEYTLFHEKSYEEIGYIADIANKIEDLYHNKSSVTLNIPLHSHILPGLKDMLTTSILQKVISKYNLNVKIIEMVKPRRMDKFFKDDFVPVTQAITQIGTIEEKRDDFNNYTNTQKFMIGNIKVVTYEYPCKNINNCKSCFNNFALTMKPNGQMLICRKAIEHNNIAKEKFASMGIVLEDVDLRKEYGY